MAMFNRRSRREKVQEARPAAAAPLIAAPVIPPPVIEALESRQYFSSQLIVTIPVLPHASAVAGVVVNEKIPVDIANNGPNRLVGPMMITLFASTDQTLDSGDVQVAQRNLPRGFVIPVGTHRRLLVNVRAFPQNLDNSYFILGAVTPNGAVGASIPTIEILPPEIEFSAAVPPIHHNGLVGHRISVTVNVTNDGDVVAHGNLAVNFGESIDQSGSSPVNLGTLSKHIIIRPGKTEVLHFLVPLPLGIPTGNQFIVADVDPMDVYNQPSLANDVAVCGSPITVT